MSTQATTDAREPSPQEVIFGMINGFWVSRTLYVAAELGLADLVKDAPKTAEELATATGTHARSLYRVLRALASVGVFSENEDGRFATTPLAAVLETGTPGSLRASVRSELGREHFDGWRDILHSVRTGETAFEHAFGLPVWEYYNRNPEDGAIFNDSMTGLTAAVDAAVLHAYDFSAISTMVDVGGGHGGFLASVLKANPALHGVLFDQPAVVEGARQRLRDEGLDDRCEVSGGSFFESVPEGGDAYLMKWIIHDWDDERATTILRNCRRVMPDHGRLLLVEMVLPGRNEPSLGKFVDLNMLAMTGGCERTEGEFRTLFENAGFRLTRVVPTQSLMSVVEGEPI